MKALAHLLAGVLAEYFRKQRLGVFAPEPHVAYNSGDGMLLLWGKGLVPYGPFVVYCRIAVDAIERLGGETFV
jgi:hypothetical protein